MIPTTEPHRGYRAWLLTDKGMLTSITHSSAHTVWQPGVNEAVCPIEFRNQLDAWAMGDEEGKSGHHVPPEIDCHCGYYAFSNLSGVMDPEGAHWRAPAVAGEVLMWGRVQAHQTGWRAQYVQVTRLARYWLHLPRSAVNYTVYGKKFERVLANYDVPEVRLTDLAVELGHSAALVKYDRIRQDPLRYPGWMGL